MRLEFIWTTSRARDTYGYNVCTLFVDGAKVARCNGGGYDMEGTCLGSFVATRFADRLRSLKPEDMPEDTSWKPDRARVCTGRCRDEWMERLEAAIAAKSGDPEPQAKLGDDCWTCPTCGADTIASRDGQRISHGRRFYGLTFHDPNYDPGQAIIGQDCSDRTLGESEGETVAQAEAAGKSVGLERLQAAYSASSPHATARHTVPHIDGACGKSSVETIMRAIGLSLKYVPTRGKHRSLYEVVA